MTAIHSILMVGGTHGNELTGVRIIEQWPALASQFTRDGLDISPLMANQRAVDQRVRFVEEDLNRQFVDNKECSPASSNHEAMLAASIKMQFGAGTQQQPDLVIDIHNTTSHMGATLICVDDDLFNQQLARFVKNNLPNTNILLENEKTVSEHPYLCTLGKKGIMIEMGAQPQGVCRADLMRDSIDLLNTILDFCQIWNSDSVAELPPCETYQFVENISFPLDDRGHVAAMVHEHLQDRDFCSLQNGEPIFRAFDGSTIYWQGENAVYPHFINEAAYQGQHVAFATARRILW
ncbi:aspartoacylase [Alteromonas facilis]|uniref:aspartoacylase n=1 Tax=Alteromonas facilis TaxID=2048004 RepID=UPI000C28851D|nr:aspartoacylase [Alteromonas facilis]